jgi:hypothetical protein
MRLGTLSSRAPLSSKINSAPGAPAGVGGPSPPLPVGDQAPGRPQVKRMRRLLEPYAWVLIIGRASSETLQKSDFG